MDVRSWRGEDGAGREFAEERAIEGAEAGGRGSHFFFFFVCL